MKNSAMNQMNPMYLFSGCVKKICYAREKWAKGVHASQILIKHVEMGFIWFIWFINYMNLFINIINKYELSHKYDEPMYPDVLRGVYGFFLHCLKKEVFWMAKFGEKMAFFGFQTTSRYIGSSATRVADTADGGWMPPRLASRMEWAQCLRPYGIKIGEDHE